MLRLAYQRWTNSRARAEARLQCGVYGERRPARRGLGAVRAGMDFIGVGYCRDGCRLG